MGVAISDQGIGIDPGELPRLFTRYGRIAADRHGISGTGLGLYVSRELARLHGGDISVESRLGTGSTFTLTLPAASRAAPHVERRRRVSIG